MRFVYLALALLAAWAAPAAAQGPQYFYCYVPSPKDGTVFVSDVHPVGPVAERRGYGDQFVAFLQSEGKISGGAVGYCVMRATTREIDKGRTDLAPLTCAECAGTQLIEDVSWPRGGTSTPSVRVSELRPKETAAPRIAQSRAEQAAPAPDLLLSEAEAGEVLKFFFEKLPPKVDENDRRFAQALILQSARASSRMSVVEGVFRSAISPAATPSGVVRAIARRVLSELAEPDTVQAALEREQYSAVVNDVRRKWKSPWADRLEQNDSSMLQSLW